MFHKAPQEKFEEGSDLEIAETRMWNPPKGRCIAQATAYSRMSSPHSGCVVTLRHVGKQHLVCLEEAGEFFRLSRHLTCVLYSNGKS
jgi:hypothetical protein